LEARLNVALRVGGRETIVEKPPVTAAEDASEAVAAAAEGAPNAWPDESAESAMLSELKSRGEVVAPASAEAVEEIDPKKLPPLGELTERIPEEVRATLDELFRAKFVRVVRVPKKSLKV
jgi:hypothetical protein